MALIYKHLLDILKVESQLNGNNDWNRKGFEQLLPYWAAFHTSLSDPDTSELDRLNVLPKALKCLSRLLTKLVDIMTNQVFHERLALLACQAGGKLLQMTTQFEQQSTAKKVPGVLADDEASVVIIFLQILTILEGISGGVGPESSASSGSTGTDTEPLTEATIYLMEQLLKATCCSNIEHPETSKHGEIKLQKLNNAFEGALGSQLVLVLLTLSKHRAKHIAGSALDCLLLAMRGFARHRGTWRACFPGTFSALFVLTQSGFKSGAAVLSKAIQALLQLVQLVGQDCLPENLQLQKYLQGTTNTGASDSDTKSRDRDKDSSSDSGAANTAFSQLLRKLKSESDECTSAVAQPGGDGSAAEPSLAAGMGTVEQYVQWRVQVLQRIQAPLAAAYREVNKSCSPTQRILHARIMGATTAACTVFLGKNCVTEWVTALLSSTTDSQNPVREAAQEAWCAVQLALQQGQYGPHDAYLKVIDGLSRRYIPAARVASSAAAAGNEEKLREQLQLLLGLGYGLRDHLAALIRVADHSKVLVGLLRILFSPDPGACGSRVTASVVETRSFTYRPSTQNTLISPLLQSVEVGYHRVAWRCAQDPETKELAGRLVLSLGRYGLLEDILAGSEKAAQQLMRHLHSNSASNGTDAEGGAERKISKKGLSEYVCRAVGALSACSIATLAFATATSAAPVITHTQQRGSDVAAAPVTVTCAGCGKASDPSHMLRCSRCKQVHYCSKDHQQHHWAQHKTLCKPNDKLAPIPKQAGEGPGGAPSAAAVDLGSPTSLLASDAVVVTPLALSAPSAPSSSGSGSALLASSPAKLRDLVRRLLQHYLGVIEHYCRAGSTGALVLPTATAAEGLANLAFSAGAEFQGNLRHVLYPLLVLMVDGEPIVKMAARSSLQRISLYSLQAPFHSLIRRNLDYIVDTICRELRSPVLTSFSLGTSNSTSSSRGSSTHLVVDAVFSALDETLPESSSSGGGNEDAATGTTSAPMFLLRDVICDTLENIDAFSLHTQYGSAQLHALLRVLHVLACRAAPVPAGGALPDYSVRSAGGHLKQPALLLTMQAPTPTSVESDARTAARSLLEFAVNLQLLKRSEEPGTVNDEGHQEGKEEEATEGEEQEEGVKPPTPGVQLLLDVVQRCCLFLTLPHTASQRTVAETMCAAFVRLSAPQHTAHLLPCIHSTWPVILNRIVELQGLLIANSQTSKSGTTPTITSRPAQVLRTAEQSSLLLAQGSAGSSGGGVGSGGAGLMTAVSTRRRTLTSTTALSAGVVAGGDRGGSTGSQASMGDVSRAFVLPQLYQLIGVMVRGSGGYMTIKVKEELLPAVYRLLAHNLSRYALGGGSGGGREGGAGQPSTMLSRAELLLSSAESVASEDVEGTKRDGATTGLPKHALWSQVKAALLSLLTECCTVEEGVRRVMQGQVLALGYLVLPLLSFQESEEVRNRAEQLLSVLLSVDYAAIRALLQACTANQPEGLRDWTTLANSPLVRAALGSSDGSARSGAHSGGNSGDKIGVHNVAAEVVLRQLHRDREVQSAVSRLLRVGSTINACCSEGTVSEAWRKRLEQWAAI